MTRRAEILSTKILKESQKRPLQHTSLLVTEIDFITIEFTKISKTVFQYSIKNAIITSQNGVKSLLKNCNAPETIIKNVFCVGEKTQAMLEQYGFKVIKKTDHAAALGQYILKHFPDETFHYFCSAVRRPELPKLLLENGISLKEIISYKTVLNPVRMDKSFDSVLFFSPSGVRSYIQKNTPSGQSAFCIGSTTAGEAEKYFKNIRIAETPTSEHLIDALIQYYKI